MIDTNGRPVHVIGSWTPKAPEHDLTVTEIRWAYRTLEAKRGNELEYRSDMILLHEQCGWTVEFDNHTESLGIVSEKWCKKYAVLRHPVMVIAKSERRLEGLMSVCEQIESRAMFAVLEDVLTTPYGDIFQNRSGTFFNIFWPYE